MIAGHDSRVTGRAQTCLAVADSCMIAGACWCVIARRPWSSWLVGVSFTRVRADGVRAGSAKATLGRT
eukprot:221293-Chlamydomonas_euryale.AAC.1